MAWGRGWQNYAERMEMYAAQLELINAALNLQIDYERKHG